jgi:hypothetical protein
MAHDIHAPPSTRFQYRCKAGIGNGTLKLVAPTPTPPSQEFGGVVHRLRVDGHSAAQNM